MLVETFVEILKDLPYLNVKKKRNICARVGFFSSEKIRLFNQHFLTVIIFPKLMGV